MGPIARHGDLTYTARSQVATTLVASTNYTYDDDGRLTELQRLDSTPANLAHYVYAYDDAGRVTSETLNGGTPTTYSYDVTNQLTDDSVTSFSYDANGNRTMEGYTTGAANQLLSDGTWNYYYDREGNLANKVKISDGEIWTYSYDNMNRLVGVLQADGSGTPMMTATYTYDALGRRIEKQVWDGSTTTTTRFSYDLTNVAMELDNTNALSLRYVFGVGVGNGVLARVTSGGTVSWLLADRLGSVRNVLNSSGTNIDTLVYDGFGNLTTESSPSDTGNIRFTGLYWDAETKQLVSLTRHYDPSSGRWVTQDPIGFGGLDTNLYRDVGNSPTNFRDPSGLVPDTNLEKGEDAKSTTDGKWDADWYFKNILGLKANYFWLQVFNFLSAATDLQEGHSPPTPTETPPYREFKRGCEGLANIRLGTPENDRAVKHAEKCFKDYASAFAFAQTLPQKDGKKVRIFATLFDELAISKEKWDSYTSEVPDPYKAIDWGQGFDTATLHQMGKDQSTWYWESMDHKFDPNNPKVTGDCDKDRRCAKVIHKPFKKVTDDYGNYNYALFCVVYAKDSALLPPSVNYGK